MLQIVEITDAFYFIERGVDTEHKNDASFVFLGLETGPSKGSCTQTFFLISLVYFLG
jgi:hypothetical protein